MTLSSNKKNYYTALLIFILVLGAFLRFYNITQPNLLHDSAASLEASLAISKYNAPILPSEVWYTRSPLYHYILGICLKLPLSPRLIGRSLTAFFSLICCYEIYLLGGFMGNRRAGLAAALLTSINPFFIYMSRTIRFYTFATAIGLLTLICFYRGYILDEKNKTCQILTFIFLPITFLLGEVSATVIPGTAIGYLLFCSKPDFRSIKIIIMGTICLTAAVVGDMMLLYAKCRTPYIAMHISTSPQIVPHLKDPFANISLFLIGDYQSNMIISFFAIAALFWALVEKNRPFFLLLLILSTSVIMVQILVLPVSQRYFFHLMPLYYLAAGFGCERTLAFISSILHRLYPEDGFFSPAKLFFTAFAGIPLLFTLISDIQPIKMYESYHANPVLNTRSEDAIKFVKKHMVPGDKLVTPFGEVATVYGIKVDYYLLRKGYFDEIFYKDGKIIERHSGGICVDNTDKMAHLLHDNQRLWLVYKDNREFDVDMIRFIKNNFTVQMAFDEVLVCLWNVDSSRYKRTDRWNSHDSCYF